MATGLGSDMTALANSAVISAPRMPGLAAIACRPLELVGQAWHGINADAVEPNGFFDPAFALAASRFAQGGRGGDALCVFDGHELKALLPVQSAIRAYGLPIPVLVGGVPFSVLGTPLLARDNPAHAAEHLIDAAARTDTQLLVLPKMNLDGPAMAALRGVAARQGLALIIHNEHERAALAVPEDAEAYLRAGMGAKRLKDLRRLRNRLDDEGAVEFASATIPNAVTPALQRFLKLEARGWKGKRGTGLGQNAGNRLFIESAAAALAQQGRFEVLELTLDGKTLASGLVIREGETALFFKIAYDEAYARFSPGVQLTVELTRRLSADRTIKFVDSTALPGHPMIDHVWRERRRVGDVMIATRPGHAGANYARLIIARDALRARLKAGLHSISTFGEKSK